MTETLTRAGLALSVQGYIIIGASEPLKPGDIVPLRINVGVAPDEPHPCKIITEATKEEFLQQQKLMNTADVDPKFKTTGTYPWQYYFYKAITD